MNSVWVSRITAARLALVTASLLLVGCPGAQRADAGDATPDHLVDARDSGLDAMDVAMDATADVPDVLPDTGCPDASACGAMCVDLSRDAHHCGACAHDCTTLPGVRADGVRCVAGACDATGACLPGRAHCSASPDDGCETDVTTPAHCGGCATACAEPTPMCSMGADGSYACASGCGGGTPTRCAGMCVDTSGDPSHCGDCATVCPAPAHGAAMCASSACGIACDAGYHGCGGACVSDADPATCGTACAPCPTPTNAIASCDGTLCGAQCNPGFADCDGNPANGCEVATQVTASNCGSCGNACGTGETCTGGACHCGAGAVCASGQTCSSGLCCPAGQSNCGGVCRTCCPNCNGRTCGSDGCGGSCGTCDACSSCNASFGRCLADGASNGRVCGVGGAGRCCAGGGCISPCLPSGTACVVGPCNANHCAACCSGNHLASSGFVCN